MGHTMWFSFARVGQGQSEPLHAHQITALRPFIDDVAEPCRESSTKARAGNSHFVKRSRRLSHATIDPSRFLITASAPLIISSTMLAALISRLV